MGPRAARSVVPAPNPGEAIMCTPENRKRTQAEWLKPRPGTLRALVASPRDYACLGPGFGPSALKRRETSAIRMRTSGNSVRVPGERS